MIRRLATLVLLMSAVNVAACGGDETAPAAPPQPAASVPEPTGAPSTATMPAPGAEPTAPATPSEPPVEPPAAPAAPVVLTPNGADRARMALGASRGLAIGADGRVYEFPLGAAGMTSTLAQPVEGVALAESVATFGSIACVVTSERRVVCWSKGSSSRQAIASIGTTPAPLDAFVDAQAVVVTSGAVCARDTAGSVTCFGRGLLSSRERTDSVFPFPLPGRAIQIAGAAYAVCAVVEDGTLHCIGNIGSRGLTGSYGPRAVPISRFTVGSIAMRAEHLCIRSADSAEVACAGDIGEWFYEDVDYEDDEMGPIRAVDAPVEDFDYVALTVPVSAIATTRTHACALTRAGGLQCWGMSYRDRRTEGFIPRAAAGIRGVTELVSGGSDERGYTCGIQGDLPQCFSSERVIERGTPGRPRLMICSAQAEDGTCTELRLAARARIAAAPAPEAAMAPDGGVLAAPTAAPMDRSCVVADASGSPLNVRDSPSSRGAVVGTLPNGTAVTSDETRGRFRHLTTPLVGWAWADNLTCP